MELITYIDFGGVGECLRLNYSLVIRLESLRKTSNMPRLFQTGYNSQAVLLHRTAASHSHNHFIHNEAGPDHILKIPRRCVHYGRKGSAALTTRHPSIPKC
jgi:hypothetical protein